MIHTIAEAHRLLTEADLADALYSNEIEIAAELASLGEQLRQNVMTADPVTIQGHMGYVESWRDHVARMLMVVSAVVEHAKGDHFLLAMEKGNTEFRREQRVRRLAGGWVALKMWLESLIGSIDSRVNLCKKILGIEGELSNARRHRTA